MKGGKLILLPNLLSEEAPIELYFPAGLTSIIQSIHGLIAESEKGGRRYLRKFLSHEEMAAKPILLLNEHAQEVADLIEPLLQGQTWGLISDAGLPCLADPGASLVSLAHQKGISVQTYAGPSSIVFALQLSGFSGQRFTFHGYLPRDLKELESAVLSLEKRAKTETQIFIEAPYRSAKIFSILLSLLQPTTSLCIAASLATPNERVISKSILEWKRNPIQLAKEPVVFLIT